MYFKFVHRYDTARTSNQGTVPYFHVASWSHKVLTFLSSLIPPYLFLIHHAFSSTASISLFYASFMSNKRPKCFIPIHSHSRCNILWYDLGKCTMPLGIQFPNLDLKSYVYCINLYIEKLVWIPCICHFLYSSPIQHTHLTLNLATSISPFWDFIIYVWCNSSLHYVQNRRQIQIKRQHVKYQISSCVGANICSQMGVKV